ncbi:hypothetical protein [Halobaculum sp. MBLA0143]
MTHNTECHIPEWAELMDASVPDAACDRQLRTFRDAYEIEPAEGS